MKIFFIFLFLLLAHAAFPQRIAQKMADNYFDEMSYASAVDYYRDLCSGSKAEERNLRKLAVCYFKLQDYEKAAKAYARLNNTYSSATSAEDLFNYIQCLKSQGKYAEADKLWDRLVEKNKNSLSYVAHRLNPAYDVNLKKDSMRYRIYNLESVNTPYSEFFPFLTGGGKQMMVVSNRRNVSVRNKTFAFDNTYFTDVYTTSMKDSLHTSQVKTFRNVSSAYHDGPATVSADASTMYVTRTNYIDHKLGKSSARIVNLKLFVFKKDAAGEWDEGQAFPYCSDEYSLGQAALSLDGKRLYFTSDMPGGFGQTDLWYSDLVNGNWQKPVNMGSDINTEGQEMFPFINEQGILFFASNGYAGLGGLDVCYAFAGEGGFMDGKLLGYPINTRFDDFSFYVNPDLRTGYFASNRPGGKGKDDIYFFSSVSPLFSVFLEGSVLNSYSKKAVPGSKVKLMDGARRVIDSAIAGADGKYHLNIPDPSKNYSLEVSKNPDYSSQPIALKSLKTGRTEQDILLYPNYELHCQVVDGADGAGLDNVRALLTDRSAGSNEGFATDGNGRFLARVTGKRAGDELHYSLKLEKPGYITSVQNVDIKLDTAAHIYLNEIVNAALQKMKKGADIGKSIKISPIYFDVAKWDIKPEAAAELDKIVAVMKENPTMKIELGSHTDCRSSKAFNLKLSDKRAKASASYIVSKGIDQSRIYGKGYGESQPINACHCEGTVVVPCTEEQHQQNRRTEFIVVTF